MDPMPIVSTFSANRLNGEAVPDDVRALLAHADELADRTGVRLHWEKDWAPWLNTSYLTEADRANPDIAANVRAITEVCSRIAFVAATEEDEYLGYWRGPSNRPVAQSQFVMLDNEGQFNLSAGSTFTEALLGQVYGEEAFDELREWFEDVGIAVQARKQSELAYPDDDPMPDDLHQELYYRYRGQ